MLAQQTTILKDTQHIFDERYCKKVMKMFVKFLLYAYLLGFQCLAMPGGGAKSTTPDPSRDSCPGHVDAFKTHVADEGNAMFCDSESLLASILGGGNEPTPDAQQPNFDYAAGSKSNPDSGCESGCESGSDSDSDARSEEKKCFLEEIESLNTAILNIKQQLRHEFSECKVSGALKFYTRCNEIQYFKSSCLHCI